MADPTRYRGERGRGFGGDDHYGGRGRDQGSDGGYIARRGFGNARAGYGPEERERHDRGADDRRGGRDWGYPREDDRASGYAGWGGGRERDENRRDYGDAAGYGSGGSWRDFRDITGRDWDDDRFRNPDEFFRGRRDRERAERERSGNDYSGGRYGADQGYGREGRGSGGRDERGFLERAGDEIASWFGDDDAARRRAQDARQEGGGYGHRGRGPRNYRRSDERIREDVSDRLMDDPHIDASDVEVGVADGEVVLTGTVDSRFAKRHAEDLAESVAGIKHVQNNLRVAQSGSMQGSPDIGAGPTGGTAGAESGLLTGAGVGGGRTRRKPSSGHEGTADLGRASEGTVTGRLGSPAGSRRTRGGTPTQ
jgi:osmotically-inducible protein OsmY